MENSRLVNCNFVLVLSGLVEILRQHNAGHPAAHQLRHRQVRAGRLARLRPRPVLRLHVPDGRQDGQQGAAGEQGQVHADPLLVRLQTLATR